MGYAIDAPSLHFMLLYLVSGEGTPEELLAYPAQSHAGDLQVKCLFPGRVCRNKHACVCVCGWDAEGMEHGYHVQGERCKQRTLVWPIYYHSLSPWWHSLSHLSTPLTMALSKWPFGYLPGLPFRTLAFGYLTLRCAICQNQPSSSQPLILLLTYLCELTFWGARCPFPSRNKKRKLRLCEPPPEKRYFLPGCCVHV